VCPLARQVDGRAWESKISGGELAFLIRDNKNVIPADFGCLVFMEIPVWLFQSTLEVDALVVKRQAAGALDTAEHLPEQSNSLGY
jgi:hypothetical protein